MSQTEQAFRKVLAENGFHVTKARQAVFELLLEPGPQAMRDLVKKAAGRIDRASVYRNVAIFEKVGIVHRIYIGWKYKLELSDEFVAHHHHLSCLKCGKVVDIHDDALIEAFIDKITRQFNFQARRHQMEIDGLCSTCQQLS